MKEKAIWRIAFELCTNEIFSFEKRIENLQDLCIILGRFRGVEKSNSLRNYIQDLKRIIINWSGKK